MCFYMSNQKIHNNHTWISSPSAHFWCLVAECGRTRKDLKRKRQQLSYQGTGGGGWVGRWSEPYGLEDDSNNLALGEFCGFTLQRDLAIFRVLGFQEMKKEREAVWFPSYFVPGYHHYSYRLAHSSSNFLSDQSQECLLSYFFSVGEAGCNQYFRGLRNDCLRVKSIIPLIHT